MYVGKPATQITTHTDEEIYTYGAGKAVDGIYLPTVHEYSSVSVTTEVTNPWWRVDLGQVHCVWGVNILNRAGKM